MKTKEIYKELNIKRGFYSVFMKRFLDIFISLIAILILSPILIITYLLTLLFLGFPAIYNRHDQEKIIKFFVFINFVQWIIKKIKMENFCQTAKE